MAVVSVEDGITSSGIILNNNENMYISNGGVAIDTIVNSGGSMNITSGGTALEIIENGGYVYVADGAEVTFASNTFSGLVLTAQSATVHSGTTAVDITLNDYCVSGYIHYRGGLHIYSGGVANSTTVNVGYLTICNGGTANSTTVNSGGYMYVSSGGVANSTTVNSGGSMRISSGGEAIDTIVSSGGVMHISSGGVANSTSLNGGSGLYNRADLFISSGGVANDTTVNSGGWMNIRSGGVASNTTLNSAGRMYISIGGVANSTTVNSGGDMAIYSGGTATDIVVAEGGGLTITVAPDTYIQGTSNGSTFEMKDATINGYTLNSGSYMFISIGGVANSTTVNSGGSMLIINGGVANSTSLNGGSDYNNRADLSISSGGVANDTTLNSGGWMYIRSGGVANSTTVNFLGSMTISSGGTATDIVVAEGGRLTITVAPDTYIQGTSNGSAFEMKDATINGYTLNSAGYMYISSGGVANSTTVNSGGSMLIKNGGVANSTSLNGGSDYNNRADLSISSGGVANDTTLNFGGWMHIFSGGVANSTTVNSGGSMRISSGGTALKIIENGGSVNVADGAEVTFASNTFSGLELTARSATVHSGTTATETTVNSGGWMTIYSGGVANSTTVNSGGSMLIINGGTALKIIENGGYVNVADGAEVTFASNTFSGLELTARSATVHSGTTATETTVKSGGGMTISSGGVANSTTVNEWGFMHISSGGMANDTTVNSGGWMYVSSRGVADSTTVNSVGRLYISSGGVANDTTVNFGGNMYISSGGVANGNLEIADGGKVTVYDGGIVDFTVSKQKTADVALINDISRITDNGAVYTLTVAEDQAFGDYVLAGNAAAFDKTITVKTDEAELGKLTVGNDFVIDGVTYALKLVDTNLVFMIDDITPPELDVTVSQKESLDYEFVVKISEPASLQYKIDNGEWQDADGTTIAIAQNGTYSFRAIDAAENVSNIFTKEISGLVFENPEKVETDGGKTSWTPVKDESGNVQPLVVQYSVDNFKTVVTVVTTESALQVLSAAGNVQWRVKGGNSVDWMDGEKITAPENAATTPQKIEAVKDGVADIFFARTDGRWSVIHQARHQGIKGGWTGTQETASLDGKSKVVDVFSGADDANVLYLTDDAKGDALFVDDIYADSFEGIAKTQARIANLDEIRAGAGDDVVDMTSQRFNYIGDGVTIYGGDGDDVIWSNKGDNKLFGDAGNDRIVGASGNDVIVGGAGDDTLHGGGGNDIFCFGSDWGIDTVEQLSGGTVTLWFEDGSEEKWNADTRTYTDGENTVTVSGTADVTLKFGGDISSLPEGIFSNAVTKKIFESTLA